MLALIGRLDAYPKESKLPERSEHYLTKRSYIKALAWIDNPELPHEV
ncbi:MAG: hypothetical protein AAGC73_02210 [Verrucomicrobiota bacterium]